MNNSIPAAAQAGANAKSPNSSVDESVRILSIRRVELACLARHLGRQRRRQAEEADHLAHTRKQVDGLLERSKQQIAQLQGNAPERIVELEKALAQARHDVEAQRRESARLAAEKAQVLARLTELGNELGVARAAVEKARQEHAGKSASQSAEQDQALANAKAELDVLRRAEARLATEKSGLEQQLAKLPELERALGQARNDVEAQRREAARLAGDKAQAAGKVAELEQALEAQRKEVAQMVVDKARLEQLASRGGQAAELEQALSQARRDLEASRQQIDQLSTNLEQAAAHIDRLAELEQLLNDAAAELEARDCRIAELEAGDRTEREARGSAATADTPDRSQTLAQLRAELEGVHQAEIHKLHLDLDALHKGNAKLRQELQQLQGQGGASPPTDVEQLLARETNLEADLQKIRKDNDKLHAALTETERERDAAVEALEQEAGQFNQQRRELEEEVRALRRKVEGGVPAAPPAVAPVEVLPPAEEPIAGDIVPEPESVEEVVEVEPVTAAAAAPREEEPAGLDQPDIADGFDFARREAELVALHRQIESAHRFLDMQLRDPQTHRVEPEPTDLVGQKSAIDQLLSEVRRAREKLMGKPSSPPVVVAPPKPAQALPRRSFQGLRRWLKGKE